MLAIGITAGVLLWTFGMCRAAAFADRQMERTIESGKKKAEAG